MNIPNYEIIGPLNPSEDDGKFIVRHDGRIDRYIAQIWEFGSDTESATAYLDKLKRLATQVHRNVCEITDFGSIDDQVYVVSPYYGGGNLSQLADRGLTIQTLIGLIRDISAGLRTLHRDGHLHGNINPANIVLDHQGSAILVDGNYLLPTGIEASFDSRYISPEQLRGETSTTQSDIYSFGVVILGILLGTPPWQSDESDRTLPRTQSDAMPPLGTQFESLSPFLKQMVAFEASDRFESVVVVQQAFEVSLFDDALRDMAIKADLISIDEINRALPPIPSSPLPTYESFWSFDRRSIVLMGVSILVLLVGLWGIGSGLYSAPFMQGVLSELNLVENPALVDARRNADALAADQKQNLQSIVAAYDAVLAIEPGNAGSLQGIEEAKARWFSRFEDALAINDLNMAQVWLNELLAIDSDDSELLRHYERLQLRRQAIRLTTETMTLLNMSVKETDASRDIALHAFREVQRLYPASPVAIRELDKLATNFLEQAIQDVEDGDIQGAIDNLGKAGMANANHPRLDGVRELIQKATTVQAEIEARLAEALRLRQEEKLVDPPADNAAELYHGVLATDPEHEEALKGLGEISTEVVQVFDELLKERDFATIRNLITRAKTVGLYPASILHMESALVNETTRISEAADLVVLAESLVAQGFLTQPAESNAVATLEEAHRLDPLNERAGILLEQCAERLAHVALDAHKAGLLAVAETYLTYARDIFDDADKWHTFQQLHGLEVLN